PSFSMSNRTSPGSGSITSADTLSIAYNRINSNAPLVINLTKIDNNFNIYYNNKPLFEARYETVTIRRSRRSLLSLISFSGWSEWAEVANTSEWSSFRAHDAEFSNNTATNIRTMRFSSSTSNYWGNGTIPEIYQLTGTTEYPVIKVTIAANGTVSLSGKTSNTSTTQSNIVPLSGVLTFGTYNYPNAPIYNASATTFSTATDALYSYEFETKTIRRAMEFRMNSLPKNANNRDVIRIRQSTQHNFPQAKRSITELDGTFSPTLKIPCTQ